MGKWRRAFDMQLIEQIDFKDKKKKEAEENSEMLNIKADEYIDSDFYLKNNDEIIKIIHELAKSWNFSTIDIEERYNFCKKVFGMLQANNVVLNSSNVMKRDEIGKLLRDSGVDLINSIGNCIDRIDGKDGKKTTNRPYEIYMWSAFLSNRIAKIIERTTEFKYGKKKDEFNDSLKMLVNKYKFNPNDCLNMSLAQVQKKIPSVEINEELYNYIRLRALKTIFYEIKNNNISMLYKTHKEYLKDYSSGVDDGTMLLGIQLPNYALPVCLHIPVALGANMELNHANIYERFYTYQAFPIKFTDEEKYNKFLELLSKNYGFKVEKVERKKSVREIAEEKRKRKAELEEQKQLQKTQEVQETQVVNDEKITTDNQIQKESQRDTQTEVINSDSESVKNQQTRKRNVRNKAYLDNDVIVDKMCQTLIENNIVNGISNEYKEVLLSVSKTQLTKFGRILSQIEEYLARNGYEGNNLEVMSAEMFVYMKAFNRGFWTLKSEEIGRQYERVLKEIKEYGNEIFGGISRGEKRDDLIEHLNEFLTPKIKKDRNREETSTEVEGERKIEDTLEIEDTPKIEDSPVIENTTEIKVENENETEPENITEDENKDESKDDLKAEISKEKTMSIETDKQEIEEEKTQNSDDWLTSIREAYSELVETEKQLEETRKQLNKELDEINSKINSINELINRLSSLESITEKNKEFIIKLKGEAWIAVRLEELKRQREELTSQQEERTKKEEEIRQNNEKINQTNQEITEKEKEINDSLDTFWPEQ